MPRKPPFSHHSHRRWFSLTLIVVLQLSLLGSTFAQLKVSAPVAKGKAVPSKNGTKPNRGKDGKSEPEISAEKIVAESSGTKSTAEIMQDQESRGVYKTTREIIRETGIKRKKERPDRRNLPDGEGALPFNRFPYPQADEKTDSQTRIPESPQIVGTQFDGATGPSETGAFPPDTMGVVGPTQVVVFLNGRLRTFNKNTGVADGFVNADTDVFFASVMATPAAGQSTFSTDPMARFDRLTNRWFLNMIDVTVVNATGAIAAPNRIMIAVSDAASNGSISGSTVWTFYQFQGDATLFTDYQSFGTDASAMYIGGNMFTVAGAFNSTKGFVIPKAPALTGSPLTVWAFSGLVATSTSAGPFAPRGVDNPDPANTGATATGYFIGVDNATFNTLMLRRVTNPGSLGPAPTISANISVATPLTTRFPVLVPHLGNTGGTGGRLDSLDDRLYAATIRNGRLWTAHNVGVNNTGVSGATNNRNAARWYELQNLATTPAVLQSGTLYDNNATNDANQRNYWIPSIMVSGQGHAALGSSIAGTNERANAFTTGRLASDTLGTLREGPGGTALPGYTATTFAYNPAGDPGGPSRRWGDYSFTSLDPKDDMTMWTIQQYTNGANSYGVRAAKLIAPAPPPIANGPNAGVYNTYAGFASINVVINGTAGGGLGFFDPGPNPPAPHTTFNHVSATVNNASVTVNSVTYNSPTQVTLNLNTVGATAGLRDLTITNPDGQVVTRNDIINVLVPTAAPADLAGRVVDANGRGVASVTIRLVSPDGSVNLLARTNSFGFYRFSDVMTGASYVLTPTHKRYVFDPENIVFPHSDEITNVDFLALSPKRQ